ncbi:MAG: hypothetical protein ACOVNU_00785 [Candidatus Kapaibacteriota bacterium]|jgi:hypothetical protein
MRYILLGILAILVILVAYAYTLPENIIITKNTTIAGNSEPIEEEIIDLKKWEQWNEWKKIDSTLNITFDEKDSGVGGRIYWGHKEKKENSIVIINYKKGSFVEFNLVWNNGADISPGKFEFIENFKKDSTKVTLTHTRELGNNPIARLMGGMANNIYDEQFAKVLKNLKRIVEIKNKLNVLDSNQNIVPITSK